MRTMSTEQYYTPSSWKPMTAAVVFHAMMFVWNPTVLQRGLDTLKIPDIEIKMLDHLPKLPIEVPKPAVVKKVPPKKHGLAKTAKPKPLPVKKAIAKPLPPKPIFKSKIEMPKFTPRSSDDIISASPTPGLLPAAKHSVTRSAVVAPLLSSKSRGIRADNVHFKLTERSGLAMPSAAVVVPIGAEQSETVSLPSGPSLRQAPTGVRSTGYSPKSKAGGDLSDRGKIGLGGSVRAPTIQTGNEMSGTGTGKTVTGKGFEIGGPIGDRKILNRAMPEYPAWAEEKGITATVQVYFTVKPDGTIRSTLRIQRSSGYSELDQLAKEAILKWRFSAASTSDESVSWGIITFRFTLA